MAKITVCPHKPGMVNHAKRTTAKITITPYKAGTVNHATMNKMANIIDTVFVGHVH